MNQMIARWRGERRFAHPLPLLLAWFALVALACNLSGESTPPPQLLPRETDTPAPLATLGYVTPVQQPTFASAAQQPVIGNIQMMPADVNMINLLDQVQSDRLMLHVDALVAVGSRFVNSAQDRADFGIGAARAYIFNQFQSYTQSCPGFYVFEQPFDVTVEGLTTRQHNIIGVIQGTDIGGGIFVVGAHYDNIAGDYVSSTQFSPGANDNASGVAAILEMARILCQRPHRATIMFVAFSSEEIARQGSRAFVERYLRPNNFDVNAMLNVDTIGSQTRTDGSINDRQMRVFSAPPNDSPSRQLARNMGFLSAQYTPNMQLVVLDQIDREGRFGDHQSFSDAGYPAVRLIEAEDDQRRQNSPNDTIDDVQPAYLTNTTRTLLALVTVMVDGLRPPSISNMTLRDNPGGTRTLVWEPIPGAAGYVVALLRPGSVAYETQVIETTLNSVEWDGFVPDRFSAVAIAARDANGLLGPFSLEYPIR